MLARDSLTKTSLFLPFHLLRTLFSGHQENQRNTLTTGFSLTSSSAVRVRTGFRTGKSEGKDFEDEVCVGWEVMFKF